MHRFFFCAALLLFAILPLEASWASGECAQVALDGVTSSDGGPCNDCQDDERDQCRYYCLSLCQSLPAAQSQAMDIPTVLAGLYLPLVASFPPFANGGPEPPPPRLSFQF